MSASPQTLEGCARAAARRLAEAGLTAPLAEAINGVEDMLYMTSNSADNGLMSLSVAFNIGTDGDINTINVNKLYLVSL